LFQKDLDENTANIMERLKKNKMERLKKNKDLDF
jgi:hypothetical protein